MSVSDIRESMPTARSKRTRSNVTGCWPTGTGLETRTDPSGVPMPTRWRVAKPIHWFSRARLNSLGTRVAHSNWVCSGRGSVAKVRTHDRKPTLIAMDSRRCSWSASNTLPSRMARARSSPSSRSDRAYARNPSRSRRMPGRPFGRVGCSVSDSHNANVSPASLPGGSTTWPARRRRNSCHAGRISAPVCSAWPTVSRKSTCARPISANTSRLPSANGRDNALPTTGIGSAR